MFLKFIRIFLNIVWIYFLILIKSTQATNYIQFGKYKVPLDYAVLRYCHETMNCSLKYVNNDYRKGIEFVQNYNHDGLNNFVKWKAFCAENKFQMDGINIEPNFSNQQGANDLNHAQVQGNLFKKQWAFGPEVIDNAFKGGIHGMVDRLDEQKKNDMRKQDAINKNFNRTIDNIVQRLNDINRVYDSYDFDGVVERKSIEAIQNRSSKYKKDSEQLSDMLVEQIESKRYIGTSSFHLTQSDQILSAEMMDKIEEFQGDSPDFIKPNFQSSGQFRTEVDEIFDRLVSAHPVHRQGIAAKHVGLKVTFDADQFYATGYEEEASLLKSIAKEMSYIAMSVLPGPGTGVGFYEAIIGEDFLGNNLGIQERAFSGIGSILDVVTLGVAGTALRTGGKVFNYLGRSLKNSKYIKKGLQVVGSKIQKISNSVGKYGLKKAQDIKDAFGKGVKLRGLEGASKSAFKAADNVGSWTPKNKHVLGGGSQSKARFNTDNASKVREYVKDALNSPDANFRMNPNLDGTFRVVTDLKKPVGVKGQTRVRVIVGNDGKVINAFPVNAK